MDEWMEGWMGEGSSLAHFYVKLVFLKFKKRLNPGRFF